MKPSLRHAVNALAGLAVAGALIYAPFPALAADSTTLVLEPLEQPEPAKGKAAAANQDVRWNLTADTLNALADNTIIEASGDVLLRTGTDELKADFARYFAETGWVYLKGNVQMTSEGNQLAAAEAEFDLRAKTGWLYKGNIFVQGPHMYLAGEKIVKHAGEFYTFEKARLTTCDGSRPAWSINSHTATVEIDGYAQLYSADVAIKNISLLYSPYLLLPVKTNRQTGLLPPDYGYSKKRGTYYTQPFFWAINDTSDLTLYTSFMSKRGGALGLEYRSTPTTRDKLWFAATSMYDRKKDREIAGSYRTNDDRYWLRGMADGTLGANGWQYRANLDYVSDQTYLTEFGNGPMGFDKSYDALYAMFHRTLADDNQNRISAGLLFKDWDRFGLAFSARYEQNARFGHGNTGRSFDTLVQQLPQVHAFLFKDTLIPGLPLEAEAQFTSGYMYRRAGVSGLRTELVPQVSLPVDLKYVSVIPTFGLRQTWYSDTRVNHAERYRKSTALATNPNLDGRSSTVPELDVQAYTEANRVWTFDSKPFEKGVEAQGPFAGWVGLRHTVQPRLRYRHTDHVDQNDNPFYVDSDRTLASNELTYSITNILTRKRAIAKKVPARAGTPGVDLPLKAEDTGKALLDDENPVLLAGSDEDVSYDYLDLLRWKLEWGYDFNEAKRTAFRPEFERRPLNDILSELTLTPLPWFSARSKMYISPYSGDITRQEYTLTFIFDKYVRWTTGLDYRTKEYNLHARLRNEDLVTPSLTRPVHLLTNMLTLNLAPKWSLALLDKRDLRRTGGSGLPGKGYEKEYRLVYTDQCYQLLFTYNNDGYDQSYSFLFQIPGLFGQ